MAMDKVLESVLKFNQNHDGKGKFSATMGKLKDKAKELTDKYREATDQDYAMDKWVRESNANNAKKCQLTLKTAEVIKFDSKIKRPR